MPSLSAPKHIIIIVVVRTNDNVPFFYEDWNNFSNASEEILVRTKKRFFSVCVYVFFLTITIVYQLKWWEITTIVFYYMSVTVFSIHPSFPPSPWIFRIKTPCIYLLRKQLAKRPPEYFHQNYRCDIFFYLTIYLYLSVCLSVCLSLFPTMKERKNLKLNKWASFSIAQLNLSVFRRFNERNQAALVPKIKRIIDQRCK